MKKLLAIATALIAGGFATPTTAQARGRSHTTTSIYVSSRASCGCPIRTRRVFTGHNRHHRPTYRYSRLPIVHTCRRYGRHNNHRRNYGHRGHRSRYGNRGHRRHYGNRGHRGHRRHYGHRSRRSSGIHFSFGR